MDKLDRKLLIDETGSSVPPRQGGTLLDPKLTALLEFLRLLYDRKRDLFSKVILKHRKKVVEHLKQTEQADKLEHVQVPLLKKRRLSVGSTRGMLVADDLKMERFKRKTSAAPRCGAARPQGTRRFGAPRAEPQSYSGPPSPPRPRLPPRTKPMPVSRVSAKFKRTSLCSLHSPPSPPRPGPPGLIKNKSLSAGPPAPNGTGGKGGKETKPGGSKCSILSCLGSGQTSAMCRRLHYPEAYL